MTFWEDSSPAHARRPGRIGLRSAAPVCACPHKTKVALVDMRRVCHQRRRAATPRTGGRPTLMIPVGFFGRETPQSTVRDYASRTRRCRGHTHTRAQHTHVRTLPPPNAQTDPPKTTNQARARRLQMHSTLPQALAMNSGVHCSDMISGAFVMITGLPGNSGIWARGRNVCSGRRRISRFDATRTMVTR